MRKHLEEFKGSPLYLFTTHGHVHVGVLDDIDDDVVLLVAPDGKTILRINLTDVSGVRAYDEQEAR